MKSMITTVLLTGLLSIGLVGCNEQTKSTTTRETKIATPSGTTTIKTETEVKKTGENPPPARP